MPGTRDLNQERRNRETLEAAFDHAEAILRCEGLKPYDLYYSAKERVLEGMITLNESVAELPAVYAKPTGLLSRESDEFLAIPRTGKILTSEMVRKSIEEMDDDYDRRQRDPVAYYRHNLESSCQQVEEGKMAELEDILRRRVP